MHKAFTRPVLKTASAQMRYLVRNRKGTRAVAQLLRISQRTVNGTLRTRLGSPARTSPPAWSAR